jgi:hypothetical protein
MRIAFILVASLVLNGCMLTRVSDTRHAKEVSELDAVGLSIDAARDLATRHGFECDTYVEKDRYVKINDVVRKTDVFQCNKSSMELICPQRRFVVFNVDPESGKIYAVGKRIRQQSCF